MAYGLLAAFFGPQFFPAGNAVASTLSALAVFAVGFAARPLGAVLFGTLADKVGRRLVMLLSVGSMALTALVIAVLPTHAQIGIWAGVILLACRIVQGLSTGIEAPLNSTYAVELAAPGRTAWVGGILSIYVQAGIMAASLVSFITSALVGDKDMASWGWRVPFIVGAVAGVSFLWMRRSLPETLPGGTADDLDKEASQPSMPEPRTTSSIWGEVWRNKLALLAIVFVVAAAQAFNYAWNVGLPSLARSAFKESPTAIFGVTTLVSLVMILLYPWMGRTADKHRISRTFTITRLIAAPFAFLMLIYTEKSIVTFTVVMLLGALMLTFTMGLYNTVSATLMPASCRVSGVGLGYAIGVALFGGTASYLMLWFQQAGALWLFPTYVAALCLVSVALYLLAYRRGAVRAGD